ncbi:MAG: hypothetical protein HFH88_00125 [Lachnospiraceae bacterium]|nr:hypothetical protein [uncultured Acetatifactor sp.]MCI8798206.1 hypothetical protein [Lachnospiraceae bacterium]
MIQTLSDLIGLDLSACNQDLVLIIAAMFLLLVISFLYDIGIMLFGYIGGKRR